MRIVVAGGTGFIGRALVINLAAAGHDVVVLTRKVPSASEQTYRHRYVQWNPGSESGGTAGVETAIDGADAVVNLAGAPIARRWNAAGKNLIVRSRVDATRALVQAMAAAKSPPRVFVSASAVGYYGPGGDEHISEAAPAGDDFLANVCRQWEAEAKRAAEVPVGKGGVGPASGPDSRASSDSGRAPGSEFGTYASAVEPKASPDAVRVVLPRIGLVLGEGGALRLMALPFRLFVGGPLGSGRQWMPWIHIDDVVGLIRFSIETETIQGPVNATAPEPIRNKEFAKMLGRVMGRPSFVPTPALAMRLVLGEMADMVLTGQRAIPEQALAAGYRFRYKEAEAALRNVLGR